MPKISVETLKNKIQIYPDSWFHMFSTNCYAYALGLDIKVKTIKQYAYNPGVISGRYHLVQRTFLYDELVDCVEKDFQTLNISYRKINPEDSITANEWKIAIFSRFYAYEFGSEWLSDFHFVRSNLDGTWSHKFGWHHFPTNKDFVKNKIENIENCYLGHYRYRTCYALKLNKK